MSWHVWTDGSCQHGLPQVSKGMPGYGGWAAIVEHGSDGRVLRGRVAQTTNVRMELRAAIEGLRVVAGGKRCVLHTDCTTLLIVYERRLWPRLSGRDGREWRELAAEFGRLDVEIDLITKGRRDPIHRRAHTIAGAEARAGLHKLPANAVPLDDGHHVRAGMFQQAVRAWRDDYDARRRTATTDR